MDESDGLENRYGGNLIMGSNPIPSAIIRHDAGVGHADGPWLLSRFDHGMPA